MFTVKQLRAGLARRFRDAATHTPRALALSIVAGAAVLASGLGVAAPAEALQAPPVGPPVLNVPSTVIGGAVGNAPASGAQLGGQIANGGGKIGTPAFPASPVSKTVGGVSQVVGAFNLGGFIGGAVDSAFGIDRDGTVCGQTGDDLGGSVLRFLSGAQCDAYKPQASYQPNTDAPTTLSGQVMTYVDNTTGISYTFQLLGKTPFPSTWSQTRDAFCGQTNVSNGWGNARYKDASNNSYSVTWLIVDSTNAATTVRASSGTGPGSWTGTCATQVPATGGIIFDLVNPGDPKGYVPGYFYGGRWVPIPGSATTPVTSTSGNPTRWKVCTITTTDGGSYSAQTANFKETDAVWPADKCPTVPVGKTAGHMTITLNGGPQVITLQSVDSSAAYQAAQTAYPNCANGSCTLDLIDGTGSCYSGDSSRCATWITDPNRDTKYKCKYGQYDAPLKECFALGNAFDPAKVAAGNGIADPATGNDTKGQTSTKPSTGTGGSADPATGDERPDCWPQGWAAFNPLNWVLQPIQCAFTPRKSELDKVAARVNTAWRATAVAKVGDTMTAWAGQLPNVSGCSGPHIAWDWAINIPAAWGGTQHLAYDGYPLSACDDPAKTLAATGRVIGALVLYFFATLAIVRNLSGIVNQKGIGEGNSA